ncbi:DUF5916 domain-containing protein [uncultured Draconibacterium sp.]|uniref:DUF5916 domain-containing protein n=1 Tax=uncultured Draconibacterium sp. TaxID=1573823 RepID=UPI002AA7679F|nr:DUF5916 domain-containing protein [uncultured Draconibacterium sp.]
MLLRFVQTLFLLTGCVCFVSAQNYNYTLSDDSLVNHYASIKRVYYATRTSMVPKIDGKLNDECWQKVGTWDGDFIQQVPHQAQAPSQETEIKILYDDKYLYFAIIAHDNEPGEMDPILGRRDELNGDVAGIALDSYQDKQTAFEFNVTSAGQKIDLMHMGEYGWDFNWNAVWDAKTSLGDSAWYAEMRVPFSQIRYSKKEEQVWGMHIWRWIHRLSEESQWKLIPIDAPAMVYIFGELRGIQDIPYKRNFEVMPYTSGQYFPNSENNETNLGFGVDGKIGVTSNFTLDYTFNPDFGQVEADPSELNLTSYEVFYDEKRPFFLEGNSILEYNSGNDMLFYSRRVGHAPSYEPYYDEEVGESLEMPDNTSIINALKLTGKNKNGFSLGLVNSMTARETATIKSADEQIKEAVEPFTNYSIARVKQDFNEGSTVLGGIFTSTIRNIKDENLEFLADNSFVGGFDFEHNWKNRKYYIAGKTFASRVNGSEESIARLQRNSRHYFQREDADYLDYDPTKTSLSGWGGEIGGGKRSGKLRITGDVEWRSPGVDLNDVGYLRQADYIDQDFRIQYLVNKPKGILLNYSFRLAQGHNWTYNGDNLRDNFSFTAASRFKNYWRFDLAAYRYVNEIDTRRLRGGPSLRIDNRNRLGAAIQTNSQRDFFVGLRTDFSRSADDITYENSYSFQVDWRISTRFMLSSRSTYVKEQDNSQYLRRTRINDNSDKYEYVVGNLYRKTFYTTFRAEFFITPELSLQYYGSPYVSSGKYLDYKRVNDSKANELDQRFEMLSREGDLLVDGQGNEYHDFSSYDFDFNFQEFRSNFVARWEYKTGSTFYFVWSHNRSSYQDTYNSSLFNSFKDIRKIGAENAFMIKFSYWFSL